MHTYVCAWYTVEVVRDNLQCQALGAFHFLAKAGLPLDWIIARLACL